MLVTITEYADAQLPHQMPLPRTRLARQNRATAGNFTALNAGTRVIRIATDTAVTIDNDLMVPGVEWRADVVPGQVLVLAEA